MLPSFINFKQFVAIVTATFLILILYLRNIFSYWKRKSIPYVYLGNFRNMYGLVEESYKYFKANGNKYFGAYLLIKPILVVTDLELIKRMLIKDFQHFTSHGSYYNERDDPLTGHLFNLEEPKWRILRTKLTPTFTSGKMKTMLQTVIQCGNQLIDHVKIIANDGDKLDIKEISSCYTTDVIGSCAFGLNCNCFVESNSKFRRHGKTILESNFFKSCKHGLIFLFPELAKLLSIKMIEPECSDFFYNIIKNMVDYRKSNNITRNDFLQLLINLKDNNKNVDVTSKNEDGLTMEELAAQAFVFFLAGFETSSTLMTYCLYELSLNLDVQDKLRNEINDTLKKYNGEITYEALMDMTYMQQVIDETLRKYPPVPFLFRKCTEDYTIPETNVQILKEDKIFIPTYQIHHDKEYYPEPEEFRPERFNEDNKKKRSQMAFLPFGEGPRICIGLRFGLMQAKVGLTMLLKNFQFTLNKSTPCPLHFSPNTFVLMSEENIYLNVETIQLI